MPTLSVTVDAGNTANLPDTVITSPGGATALSDSDDGTFDDQTTNTSGTYGYGRDLSAMASDFGSMDTGLQLVLRYGWQSAPSLSTWDTLAARIMASDGTTVLAAADSGGAYKTIASPGTTSTPTDSAATTFDYVNTGATKAQWDGAIIQVRWVRTRTKGGDALGCRVYKATLSGTYSVGTPLVNLTGSSSNSGGLAKRPLKVKAGASTDSGFAIRLAQLPRTGTATDTGALATSKTASKAVDGASANAGALVKQADRVLTGAATNAGVLFRSVQRAFAGAAANAGALAKQVARSFSGAATGLGLAILTPQRLFSGASSDSGILARTPAKALVGTSTDSGLLVRLVNLVRSGVGTTSGALVRQTQRLLAGAATNSGTVDPTKTGGTPLVQMEGSSSSSGSIAKEARTSKSGSSSSTGTAIRTALLNALAGAASNAGALARALSRIVAGSSTSTGSVGRQIQLFRSGASPSSGNLVRHTLLDLSASSSSSGDVTPTKEGGTPLVMLDGVSGNLGGVILEVRVNLTGLATNQGALVRQPRLILGGASDSSGDVGMGAAPNVPADLVIVDVTGASLVSVAVRSEAPVVEVR